MLQVSTPEDEADVVADHLVQLLLAGPDVQNSHELRLRPLQAGDIVVLTRR